MFIIPCALGLVILTVLVTGKFALRTATPPASPACLSEHSRAQASTGQEAGSSRDRHPAAYWMDLAGSCLEEGLTAKVFECYENAIAADPVNSAAYHNLGDAILLFRIEAASFYSLDEQQVFDRAFDSYAQAMTLDPDNYSLAADVALSYYLVQPRRPVNAMEAWHQALERALTDGDRAECYVNLARTQINAGLLNAACESVAQIKDPAYAEQKQRLLRRIASVSGGQTVSRSCKPGEPNHNEAIVKAGPALATMPWPVSVTLANRPS